MEESSPDESSPMALFGGGGGGWNSRRDYMRDKVTKMRDQRAVTVKSALFRGLSFWITGRTRVLNDTQIKQMVEEHGGRYEPYGFTSVSHIICENLAMANQRWQSFVGQQKIKKARIVTPNWILDSITMRRRLPEVDYTPKCLQQNATRKKNVPKEGEDKKIIEVVTVSWLGDATHAHDALCRLHKDLPQSARNRRVRVECFDAVWCGGTNPPLDSFRGDVRVTLIGEKHVRAPPPRPRRLTFVEHLLTLSHVDAAGVLIKIPPIGMVALLPQLDDELRALAMRILRRRHPDFPLDDIGASGEDRGSG
eukprot:GEMP01015532.1.p1 GENE.GEMP01015532.1~~GEMP01015532.1.p1  ORF type:complete len:308 (+),score=66.94 GEMP01015532.1:64-987(+)